MIYALNMTCDRDEDLKELMLSTFTKHSGSTSWISKNSKSLDNYGNGAGWGPSMMKLDLLSQAVHFFNPSDTDFLLSVDSDVVFTSPEVFKYVVPDYGIIGIKHRPEFETARGKWSHMSGALIFLRGDIARKMIALTNEELYLIRLNFKSYDITENEDVVLSYLAAYVGASYFDLGSVVPGLSNGNFESDVAVMNGYFEDIVKPFDFWPCSFYHLNYCPTQFLGEPVTGKWDIPKVLKMKGIEL